ncbi:hypothetical protein LIER_13468 [Lithospermum erythrorhizon]|uniref:Uncharacterized protein n=1 Tax=Lithospermum erythrorhizon TaxID=34254 RepID=A0AAV3PX28_LITER
MITDSQFYNLPESFDDSTIINETPMPTPTPEESLNVGYGLEIEDSSSSIDPHNYVFSESHDFGTQVRYLSDSPDVKCVDDHESDSVFEYLNQILMEETVDQKPSMFHDPLALQATEKSFYDVIDKKYPPSPSVAMNSECPQSLCEKTCKTIENSVDSSWSGDPGYYYFSVGQVHPSNRSIQSAFTSSQSSDHSVNTSTCNSLGQIDSFMNMNLIPSQFSDNESKFLFWKGMEDARKFLPSSSELVVGLDKNIWSPRPEKDLPKVELGVEKDHSSYSRGRKHLHCQDSDIDTRSRKLSAVYEDDDELIELMDNVLIRDVEGVTVSSKGDVKFRNGIEKYWEQNPITRMPKTGKSPSKTEGVESVYLQSLLLSCAQAAASNDFRNAQEQLKQIRQYASCTGDASQRVANVFANGLEARLAGTVTQMYAALPSKRISPSDMLRAYQVYLSICPFKEIATCFANKIILKIAAKGPTLHIVDFGISYGFQWPAFIQFLSMRQSGPPKLRITGIDFPQAGFRPAELIEETGQRLAKYCKRFNVPFEYQSIACQNWETIDINDLKLARDEILVVNCLYRFQHLHEETEIAESPKDGVLRLIKSMKPDLFVHSVINGSYNSPFFMTRFREAFFYYASLFDMLHVTLPHDDLQRLDFEKEFYMREVVNIIACEGKQRVVRSETYKQWQIRSVRAGLKCLPVEDRILLKGNMEAGYHKDFLYDEDCNWVLQGWKGRVLFASSCWVPV